MEFVGIIKQIEAPYEGVSKSTGKAWQKAGIVVETEEMHPNSLYFALLNERISELTDMKVGTRVRVSYSSSVSHYNGRAYNNLSVSRIEWV